MRSDEDAISELVDRLAIRRTPNDENQLCRLVRYLPDERKLGIIERLACFNVRLAATVGVRGNLGAAQQAELFDRLLVDGQSNAIKHFVLKLFADRLRTRRILQLLKTHQQNHPKSVHFAAYYLLGTGRMTKRCYRNCLVDLMQATSSPSAPNGTADKPIESAE
jgi:hypothetical protein